MSEYIKKEDAIKAVTDIFRVSAIFSGMSDNEELWREKAEKVLSKCEVVTDTADTPQTDCEDTSCPYFKNPDYSRCMKCKSQTESTGSPIGDYRDGVGAWQTDCDDRYAIRTDSGEVVAYACPLGCEQTDCGWGEPNE